LGEWLAPAVQDAARDALDARRTMTTEMSITMFERLGIRPRIAPEQAGDLLVALVSGLAVESGGGDPAAAFDVLVLALIGLEE
jgi:hypothetical protein